jgi:hypothetical protein
MPDDVGRSAVSSTPHGGKNISEDALILVSDLHIVTYQFVRFSKMTRLVALTLEGRAYSRDIFGGNILAPRDRLGEAGTYDDVAEALGLSHVRYPGGSLTEFTFDISNPNASRVIDAKTGSEVDFLPFDAFLAWAGEGGLSVTIVLPTRTSFGTTTDANGDRYPEIDEAALRGFVRDTLDGRHGQAEIRAFEIGNEYWGSGEMSSVEYGRLAGEMAAILKEELDAHPAGAEVDVVVQIGQNYGQARLEGVYAPEGAPDAQLAALAEDYGMPFPREIFLYGNGDVAWPKVQNALLLREFDDPAEIRAVDGVALHIYGRGLDRPDHWDFDYRLAEAFFTPKFGDVQRYVTEWNSFSEAFTTPEAERYGLIQAREMLQITEAMTTHRVEAAHIWAVQQNTATDLSGNEGQAALTVAGEMFRLMSESLPGLTKVDLAGSTARETEVEADGVAVHVFAAEDRMVMFIAATGRDGAEVALDTSALFVDPGSVSAVILGVEPGDDPASRRAEPLLEEIDPASILTPGGLAARLDGHEILRVEFASPTWTGGFARILAGESSSPAPQPDPGLPILPPIEGDDPDGQAPPEDGEDHDEGDGGIGGALGLIALPLLLLMALASGGR